MGVVSFPPSDQHDAAGWCRGLLTDLAGDGDTASELLAAVNSVRSGEAAEWSMGYNAYSVKLTPIAGIISFIGDECQVPLDVLATVVAAHLAMLSPDDGTG